MDDRATVAQKAYLISRIKDARRQIPKAGRSVVKPLIGNIHLVYTHGDKDNVRSQKLIDKLKSKDQEAINLNQLPFEKAKGLMNGSAKDVIQYLSETLKNDGSADKKLWAAELLHKISPLLEEQK
jgi:hypothetical protein